MHDHDLNRVEFYSKEDMAGGYHLSKGEHILRSDTKSKYEDINDVLELYNIKQYLDNELYLKKWTEEDIALFKIKAVEYGKIVGQFMSNINDGNVISYFEQLLRGYINSFWELLSNQRVFKKISNENFAKILEDYPHEIRTILTHKNLVTRYNSVLRDFLLTYPQSAEILLSIYEERDDFSNKKVKYLPQSLTEKDKEKIVSDYIEREENNLNYLRLIIIARNRDNFKLSDKTRLKAKRKEKQETDKMFEEQKNISFQKYGVAISFPEKQETIKKGHMEEMVAHYSYSYNHIKKYNDFHTLFYNFKLLFEYLDFQNRIELVHKNSQMGVMERIMGVRSKNEYRRGIAFNMSEMTSHAQIIAYYEITKGLGKSIENILQYVFTSLFHEKYNFPNNARLCMPSLNVSNFEKVRFIAPEFESVLKQFKLFVNDGEIDFELLQMSSTPSSISSIPSLNKNKYIYFNDDNKELVGCTNLFFSDQTVLAHVKPHEEKRYHNLFDLLINEDVDFSNYEEHQKDEINYLIQKEFLFLDKNNLIQFINIDKVLILKDLYENEVACFYHYPKAYQLVAEQMEIQKMVVFESSLFSRPEQSYFNYYLNKSEFTNGQDLRNSYLHGTQANPEEHELHKSAYFMYLKFLVLVLLKIEDDLMINYVISNENKKADG